MVVTVAITAEWAALLTEEPREIKSMSENAHGGGDKASLQPRAL